MEIERNHIIIHVFAILHLAMALGCRLIAIPDDLLLTLLSMLLIVIICLRQQTSAVFMVVSVIVVNVIGFVLGKAIALGLSRVVDSPYVIYPLSTFVCTELVGWGCLFASNQFSKRHRRAAEESRELNLRWLLLAFVLIIVVRLVLMLFGHDINETRNMLIGLLLDYAFSCGALVWIAEYAIKYHQKAQISEMNANLAQYRYAKLKQQVNPHFLFNSLNILDCLILENNPRQASSYVHKLADIYRYMTGNDDKRTVNLEDEMDFVSKYIDLISVRWPEGLEFQIDIPKDQMKRKVIPCSIQMLIENAIKHNAVLPDRKLMISIRATDKSIVVGNNRNPKFNGGSSTGIGLANLRQQYRDLGDKSIIVKSTDEAFTVILPFL